MLPLCCIYIFMLVFNSYCSFLYMYCYLPISNLSYFLYIKQLICLVSKLYSSYVCYKYTVIIEYKVYMKSVKLNMSYFCNNERHTLFCIPCNCIAKGVVHSRIMIEV